MPLNPFTFENTDTTTPEGRNQRIFDLQSKTLVKTDLTITLGLVNTPTVQTGYFTMYGPIVFYNIQILLNNNDGWGTSTIVSLPFPCVMDSTNVPIIRHQGTAFNSTAGGLGATITTVYPTVGGYLSFSAAYTNVSGADQQVTLQGWYFRN